MTGIQVTLNQAKLLHVGDVILKPGVNVVTEELADYLRKHPHIKKLVAADKIKIHDAPPSTKGLNVADATELIKNTIDEDLLTTFEANDKRAGVQKAIAAQRELIKPTKKKTDGDDEG